MDGLLGTRATCVLDDGRHDTDRQQTHISAGGARSRAETAEPTMAHLRAKSQESDDQRARLTPWLRRCTGSFLVFFSLSCIPG